MICQLARKVDDTEDIYGYARPKKDYKTNPQSPYDPSYTFVKCGYAQTEHPYQRLVIAIVLHIRESRTTETC